jgi:cyclopropane-fatty-acyl-phospholipid synthase
VSVAELRLREGEKYGGSPAGIRHHYDIGNDFWALMLGPRFTYSAALYERADESHEAAQDRKIAWHLRAAGVERARSVLEVGCGWGTLLGRVSALPHVRRIVGLTLSEAQAVHLRGLRLPGVEIRVENWAAYEPREPFDSIVSIGAFEHFAKREETPAEKVEVYRDFFGRCARWLTPHGRMAPQTIAYGHMRREDASPFMYSEIYPDSDLPFLADIVAAADGVLEITALRNDRFDYARSYDAWAANLRRRRGEAVAMVGEAQVERFERFFRLGSIGFRMGKLQLLRLALRPASANWAIAGRDDGPRPDS